MARIRTDEIWWNNPFLLNFISFYVCSFSSKEQLDFCWWIFLLKLFSVEISIGWIFWVEMPLQILFGKDFLIWLAKISLRIFGQTVSFKCFLVVVLLPQQQPLLSEKHQQISTVVQSFHVTKIKSTIQILIGSIESGFLVFWLCFWCSVSWSHVHEIICCFAGCFLNYQNDEKFSRFQHG